MNKKIIIVQNVLRKNHDALTSSVLVKIAGFPDFFSYQSAFCFLPLKCLTCHTFRFSKKQLYGLIQLCGQMAYVDQFILYVDHTNKDVG